MRSILLTTLLLTTLAHKVSADTKKKAGELLFLGDVVQEKEGIHIQKKVFCHAYSGAAKNPSVETLMQAKYLTAMQIEEDFTIIGQVDNLSFSIHGDMSTGHVQISIGEEPKNPESKWNSSSGFFSAQKRSTVSATEQSNGRLTKVSCTNQIESKP